MKPEPLSHPSHAAMSAELPTDEASDVLAGGARNASSDAQRTRDARGHATRNAEAEGHPVLALASLEVSPRVPPGTLIAECLATKHPSLQGRIQVRWASGRSGPAQERDHVMWVPTLSGLVFRVGDRVLLTQPDNGAEPIAMGVVDGFARRPPKPEVSGPSLAIERDESLTLTTAEGTPLAKLRADASGGLELAVLHPDLCVSTPGTLRLSGQQVEIEATEGRLNLKADEDVVVKAERIHLN